MTLNFASFPADKTTLILRTEPSAFWAWRRLALCHALFADPGMREKVMVGSRETGGGWVPFVLN